MKTKIIMILTIIMVISGMSTINAYADYYQSNTILYKGMQNNEVMNLQRDLAGLGYFYVAPSGIFGSYTEQTVMKFQKDHYLTADGVVGHATARQIKAEKIVRTAKKYLDVPYVWGGSTSSGFDCSGYTSYVMSQNGIAIPRTAEQQYNQGVWISKSQLQKGDLVFFSTYKAGPSHVGIYLGNNQFAHASSGWGKVAITELSNSYFAPRYIGAKRVIW